MSGNCNPAQMPLQLFKNAGTIRLNIAQGPVAAALFEPGNSILRRLAVS
jgi:hypothetical protein